MKINKEMQALIKGEFGDPFSILGPHSSEGSLCIRAFLPEAKEAWVLQDNGPAKKSFIKMTRLHKDGLFEAIGGHPSRSFRYTLRVTNSLDEVREFYDPYSFP